MTEPKSTSRKRPAPKASAKGPALGTFGEVVAAARPRETVVPICVRGDLEAELQALESELQAKAGWKAQSAADKDPRPGLLAQLRALQEEMRGHEVPFRLRALSAKAFSDLLAAHPSESKDEAFDADKVSDALVVACVVEPPGITDEGWAALKETLNHGQADELAGAAWTVNKAGTSVPFSVAALLSATAPGAAR